MTFSLPPDKLSFELRANMSSKTNLHDFGGDKAAYIRYLENYNSYLITQVVHLQDQVNRFTSHQLSSLALPPLSNASQAQQSALLPQPQHQSSLLALPPLSNASLPWPPPQSQQSALLPQSQHQPSLLALPPPSNASLPRPPPQPQQGALLPQSKHGPSPSPSGRGKPPYWKSSLDALMSDVPKTSEWSKRRLATKLDSLEQNHLAISILLGRDELPQRCGSAPQGGSSMPSRVAELSKVVEYYAKSQRNNERKGKFYERLSRYQSVLFLLLCDVMIKQGENPNTVNDIMQKAFGKSTSTNLARLRRGAVWVSQQISTLHQKGWGYRSSEIFVLCALPFKNYGNFADYFKESSLAFENFLKGAEYVQPFSEIPGWKPFCPICLLLEITGHAYDLSTLCDLIAYDKKVALKNLRMYRQDSTSPVAELRDDKMAGEAAGEAVDDEMVVDEVVDDEMVVDEVVNDEMVDVDVDDEDSDLSDQLQEQTEDVEPMRLSNVATASFNAINSVITPTSVCHSNGKSWNDGQSHRPRRYPTPASEERQLSSEGIMLDGQSMDTQEEGLAMGCQSSTEVLQVADFELSYRRHRQIIRKQDKTAAFP
ncbi:hypothetical protein AOQ84DRAFT_441312 [Glonium stellatum]|uniref:Uncharacterized protein n=1 Tax=Glonium stellatum TaxID=574774 RepID=A0A8E2JQC3_9PEZI|nr:hypothetical protein AOQ84DRAFT_441312 [Glonium stellatum]